MMSAGSVDDQQSSLSPPATLRPLLLVKLNLDDMSPGLRSKPGSKPGTPRKGSKPGTPKIVSTPLTTSSLRSPSPKALKSSPPSPMVKSTTDIRSFGECLFPSIPGTPKSLSQQGRTGSSTHSGMVMRYREMVTSMNATPRSQEMDSQDPDTPETTNVEPRLFQLPSLQIISLSTLSDEEFCHLLPSFGTDSQLWPEYQCESFNVLAIDNPTHLKVIVFQIISEMVDLRCLHVPLSILWEYIRLVAASYRPNPFHNFHHAVSVLHFMYVMLKKAQISKSVGSVSMFAFLISALAHDVDHPGKTNVFEINSGSSLAILYNDNSVLENHHCSTAFRLMQSTEGNILGRFSFQKKREFRQTTIACILATDMSKHADLLETATANSDILSQRQFSESVDQIYIGRLFLHSADLSGPTKSFDVSRRWSALVSEEYNAQVAVEIRMGLPVLGFMAVPDELTFLRNEIGFSSFFVAPLWKIVSDIFPELRFAYQELEKNISEYKKLKEELEESIPVGQNQ